MKTVNLLLYAKRQKCLLVVKKEKSREIIPLGYSTKGAMG
jgi:hypothetical protein